MTEFGHLLRDAAGQPPRPLDMVAVRHRAARLGLRRVGLGMVCLGALVGVGGPIGVSLLPAGDRPAGVEAIGIDEDRHQPTPSTGVVGPRPSPETTSTSAPGLIPLRSPTTTPGPTDGAAFGVDRTQAAPNSDSTASWREPEAFTQCMPLIVDARGDVDNPAIDILESSTTYDAGRNTLVIRHLFADIPPTPPLPNEALSYRYDFTLDGTWYMAVAYIGPHSAGEWYFGVERADRTRPDQWPNVPRKGVMQTPGRVDTDADTVEIEINIDEFNRGERRVAAEEGLAPAAELKRGSRLTDITLTAFPRSVGPGPYDVAYGRCSYVVE